MTLLQSLQQPSMHDQRCSIAIHHAKSFGDSTYVHLVTESVQPRLDAALQGFIATLSTSNATQQSLTGTSQ